MTRERTIIKTSVIGVITNVLLAIFKAIVGFASSSIAIVLDAVNNLTDVFSSVVTIIGTKLANKAPDKEHPYGHGRIEYLSSMIIAIIILYAGFEAFKESLNVIINPKIPEYSSVTIIIVSIAIIVKLILGLYVKKIGKKVNSKSLINSGIDALMDAIVSFSTLLAAIIYLAANISLEAYLGLIISLIIIRSGYLMLRSTLSQILGMRIDKQKAIEIKKTIQDFSKVKGAYDLMLNDYGPTNYMGSVHIEIDEEMKANEIDELTRNITHEVYRKHGVILTAIGIYSINTKDKEAIEVRNAINNVISKIPSIIQVHGYYFNKKENIISFDIIIDFNEKERNKVYKELCKELSGLFPNYKLRITMDFDVSD